ncbi:MAG TPA: CehA/McbA family metallohydrolase [Vicinamibacterales bacterium]|nr:CehA/McbA family metallohydrolase [Vicinamibacterales bacterium]
MRKRIVIAAIASAAVVTTIVMLPPRSVSLPSAGDIPEPVRGVVHVHTVRSDGSGTLEEIAAAAARAGLKFVILTDHGDGTREPEPPAYRHGVLCIDAVEVTTFAGHLVALGLASAAPYPLGGEPRDVVEDVERLGGMSIAAHPVSEKAALRWNGWTAQTDGLEWLNADSEWRNEHVASIARAFITYPWRQSETLAALLQRPAEALSAWDNLTRERRVVALAAVDAHANLGLMSLSRSDANRSSIALPGYEHIFRTFSVALPQIQLTGDAMMDAGAVVREIRSGHVYSSIDALASPARMTFTASSGGRLASPGDELPLGGSVAIRAQTTAPRGSRTTLLANGRPVKSSDDATLTYEAPAERAAYRLEVRIPGTKPDEAAVPWLLSNPIYVGGFETVVPPPWQPRHTLVRYADGPPLSKDGWGIEKNGESQALLDHVKDPVKGGTRLLLRYALSGSTAGDAWIGLGMRSGTHLAEYDRVMFTARAEQPMRLWVQLWRPTPTGNQYWRRSVYLDPTDREISVRFDDLRPVDDASETPPLTEVQSIMFVVDRTHTPLGRSGKLWIDNIRYAR